MLSEDIKVPLGVFGGSDCSIQIERNERLIFGTMFLS